MKLCAKIITQFSMLTHVEQYIGNKTIIKMKKKYLLTCRRSHEVLTLLTIRTILSKYKFCSLICHY